MFNFRGHPSNFENPEFDPFRKNNTYSAGFWLQDNNFNLLVSHDKLERAAASVLKDIV
jgi:hypothetical protein